MWQEILAADSSFPARMAQNRDLRPLYLKRRMQLLQTNERNQHAASKSQNGARARSASEGHPQAAMRDAAEDRDVVEFSEAGKSNVSHNGNEVSHTPQTGPIRNRRYLSLRVKLLKRQFGLPNEVLNLKSLSLTKEEASNANKDENGLSASMDVVDVNGGRRDKFSFGGVHRISDLHSAKVTRLLFTPDGTSVVSASVDGSVAVVSMDGGKDPGQSEGSLMTCTRGAAIVDADLSESGELLVAARQDGSLDIVSVGAGGRVVRSVADAGASSFARFLPVNNNLIAVAGHGLGVRIVNASTGKSVAGAAAPALGRTTSVALSPNGIIWLGNDRGHVESFRVTFHGQHGQGGVRVQKGCRLSLGSDGVNALAFRAAAKCEDKPTLLAATAAGCHVLEVADDFGTLRPATVVPGSATSTAFGPLLTDAACAATGSRDGSVCLLDVSARPPVAVNRLLGHSRPVSALVFSQDESYLASADDSGQVIVWSKK